MAPHPPAVVLLVEDDPAVLALLSHGLEQHGYQVVKAQSTLEALQRAKDFAHIDVLATDVVLPSALKIPTHYLQAPPKHGIDLMKRLLTLHPHMRIIVFSGQTDETLAGVGGVPQGIVFLRKPLSGETLAQAVHQILQSPESSFFRSICQRVLGIYGPKSQSS
jgi:two-component system cell cycle sensor histidine kinase/response regulator CckA